LPGGENAKGMPGGAMIVRTVKGRPPRPLRAVIRAECANARRDARCVFDHECWPMHGRRCRYFERAVLPSWPEVAAEYARATAQERLAGVVLQEGGDGG